MRLRWLAIVCLPVLLSGCEFVKPRACPDPGGITNNSCIYALTITKPSPGPDLAIGKVPEKIVEANSKRRLWGDLIPDFNPKDFPSFEYAFHIKNANTLTVNETYDLVNKRGTYYLEPCDLECNVRRIKDSYYPDKPETFKEEIRRCLTEDKC